MLRILYMIAKIDKNESKAPEWMLLFKAGWGKLATGETYLVDEQCLVLVNKFIADRGNEVVFDYEHASLEKEAAPASGWIKELVWEDGVGIKARVEWTEKAAKFIASKEYRYFSPVFAVRKSDSRVCYLDSVALTNRPKTNNLTPILAKLEAGLGDKINEEETMDRKKLIAALGLKDDASDMDILMAVAKLGVKLPKEKTKEVLPKAIAAALDLKETDTESVVVASIHALKQTSKTSVSVEDFNALQKKFTDRDATDAVVAAMAKGKVTPDQKDWAMEYATTDLEGFKVYVSKAPVVIPVETLPGKTETSDGIVKDEAVIQVAKSMGVDLEDIKKYNG